MVKVYGASDDLIEIDGSVYKENEIGCYNSVTQITFTDGAVIQVAYPKPGMGVWGIKVLQKGTGHWTLDVCKDEEAKIYSDIYCTDAEIVSHELFDA